MRMPTLSLPSRGPARGLAAIAAWLAVTPVVAQYAEAPAGAHAPLAGEPVWEPVHRLPATELDPVSGADLHPWSAPRAAPLRHDRVFDPRAVGRAAGVEPPAPGSYPGRLASYPDSSAELPPPEVELRPPLRDRRRPAMNVVELPAGEAVAEPERDPNIPADARKGVFQKLIGSGTWLAPDRSGGLGIYELETRVVLAAPFPLPRSHLLITPGYGVHWLDGPIAPDLPPAVHDTWTSFRLMWPATRRWAFNVGVTPGVFSDFQQSTDEAIRISGNAGAMITWTPELKLLVGVAYLDREDINILPFGGVIWEPNDLWKIEVSAPRPRIARRLDWGRSVEGVKQWLYLAGEFGGGSWAVRRASGLNDVITLSDFRVILGWERKVLFGLDGHVEAGYVFGRRVDYKSGTPVFKPSDTVMLRGGFSY